MIKKLVFIVLLLLVCIAMMITALVVDEKTFGQISGYFSIVCVVISLIGVLFIIRRNKRK